MSYMEFQQGCRECRSVWNAAFGMVGTTRIAEPADKCPHCGSREIVKVGDGWKITPLNGASSVRAHSPHLTPELKLDRALAANAKLRAALRPFAELIYPQRASGEHPILPPLPGKEPITVRHVEAARAALAEDAL